MMVRGEGFDRESACNFLKAASTPHEVASQRKVLRFNMFGDKACRRVPGDSKNIEKTIIDKTAEITSSAMQIPRQFLFSVDDIASSCEKGEIKESLKFIEAAEILN